MIRCHLSRLMGEHKLKISDVARETGLNRGTITRLYQESVERFEADALNALCAFFECQIGELLEYVPDEE